MLADLARAHTRTQPDLAEATSHEIAIAERQLLAAQGEVMAELATLGGGPTRRRENRLTAVTFANRQRCPLQ